MKWTDSIVSAFHHLTRTLCNVCELTFSSPQDLFVLQTDASLLGLGAMLSMETCCASQTRGVEKNYSATELEALGAVAAIEHFIAKALFCC